VARDIQAERGSIFPSYIPLKIEKPAGEARRLITRRCTMLTNMLLLLLILVILGVEAASSRKFKITAWHRNQSCIISLWAPGAASLPHSTLAR